MASPAFYESSLYDFSMPPAAEYPYTGYGSPPPLTTSLKTSLPSSGVSNLPTFDPDSPFNSALHPLKLSANRDGRLKSMLSGVGSDGGFLTSPVVNGVPKMGGGAMEKTVRKVKSLIGMKRAQGQFRDRVVSSASTVPGDLFEGDDSLEVDGDDSREEFGEEEGGNEADREAVQDLGQSMHGLGVGMNGGSMVSQHTQPSPQHPPAHVRQRTATDDLDLGAFVNSDMKIYGLPRDLGSHGAGAYLPYPEQLPTATLGRGKKNTRDVAGLPHSPSPRPHTPHGQPSIELTFVEHRFPPRTPQQAGDESPQGTAGKKPRKNLTVKTKVISRAKSCSALHVSDTIGAEPLTPISSHGAFNHAHFSAPGAGGDFYDPHGQHIPPVPMNFAELYNHGLATEALNHYSPRKHPNDFANDLIRGELSGPGLGAPYSAHNPHDPPIDPAVLYGLPTPHLPTPTLGSPFSSPGSAPHMSPNLSQISQVLLSPGQMFPTGPSSASASPHHGHGQHAMYAPQMESAYSLPLPSPAVSSGFPSHGRTQHAPMSRNDSAPIPSFSYPTSFRQQHGHNTHGASPGAMQHMGPYAPPPPAASGTPWLGVSPQMHQHQQHHVDPNNPYALPQALPLLPLPEQTFGYPPSGSSRAPSHGKRARTASEEGDQDDEDGDWNPSREGSEEPGNGTKRRRVIHKAQSMPVIGRRLKPGPKPKNPGVVSPELAHQSVFPSLSPPVPQFRAFSPYMSDGSPAPEGEEGEYSGTVSKEIIQSFYSAVPSHMGPNGVKVAKKYQCLIEGCDRTFPRKSAVESHIQTHLEDKPFICSQPDCGASFVRQHDLRRHERIHSGNKPFPCPCGKGFARGDALMRHRQRGICEGSLVPRRC